MVDPLLLTSTRILTYSGQTNLTAASGFFFERDDKLYLVTSCHVLHDPDSMHSPDRIEIEIHTDPNNLADSVFFSIPLYQTGFPVWREADDYHGRIDVAVIEIQRDALPETAILKPFTPSQIQPPAVPVPVGTSLVVVGFPLGFHDTLHHTPVARHAILSSSYGYRFQGKGYFLTDSRLHRGSSGSPVVMASANDEGDEGCIHWRILGVHSARLDVGNRDAEADERLGLNCAWYADTLMTLTA